MRTLLLHTNRFQSRITAKSTRPVGIQPEPDKDPSKEMKNCLTVLFCIERTDTEHQVEQLYQEIVKSVQVIKVKRIMLMPFAHLSRNTAHPERAKELYQKLMLKFVGQDYTINYSHFGYHKSWLLDIKGHCCACKYREFT